MQTGNFMINTRHAGYVFIAFGIVLFVFIAWVTSYLLSVNSLLHKSCNLDAAVCPFVGFPIQSVLGFIVVAALFAVGIIFVSYFKREEKAKKITTAEKQTFVKAMTEDEKKIYEIVLSSGALFQSDIVEKSNINKVKVSRILDKLEGKGLVERRRRGMSNVIVPKNS